MNLTLNEIEMLLLACSRVGQSEDILGAHFKTAKSKLQKERKRIITPSETQLAVGEMMQKAAKSHGMNGDLEITVTR